MVNIRKTWCSLANEYDAVYQVNDVQAKMIYIYSNILAFGFLAVWNNL